jgi:hypothetical protein
MTVMKRSGLVEGTISVPSPSTLRSSVIKERFRCPSARPVPFERVLLEHCERIAAGGSCRQLLVRIERMIEGACPVTHEMIVLRVVDELLSNAIEHGFYRRQRGRVLVHVASRATAGLEVSVSDDGWGFDSGPIIDGNGFHLLRQIGDLRFGAAAAPFVAKAAVTLVTPLPRCGRCSGG